MLGDMINPTYLGEQKETKLLFQCTLLYSVCCGSEHMENLSFMLENMFLFLSEFSRSPASVIMSQKTGERSNE